MKYYLIADPDYNENKQPREVELTKDDIFNIIERLDEIKEYRKTFNKIREVLENE